MRQFWLKYFIATEEPPWLTCPNTLQRLEMLEELMQWEMTSDS